MKGGGVELESRRKQNSFGEGGKTSKTNYFKTFHHQLSLYESRAL